MVRLAITGGIACGKSLVGRMLQARGIPVYEADSVGHELMRCGQPAYGEILRVFGSGILAPDREIDRGRLGDVVFSDPGARADLNAILHPAVDRQIRDWLNSQKGGRAPLAAVIVPLLFEAGFDRGWDAILCVSASDASQVRRLQERGLSAEQARQRIEAQWPVQKKAERSDFVLVNNGARELLEKQTVRMLKHILEKEPCQTET